MKIFLSWSGDRSRVVAEALNDWLPRVIQAVKPFYSGEIEKGAKWSNEIDDALEGTRFGIICLTPDNLNSPWIHFEAGALSKTKDALVWTLLHTLTPGDVPPPLGKFQHTVAERADVLRLVKAINGRIEEVGGEPLQDRLLEENFEVFWPRLEEQLKIAEGVSSTIRPTSTAVSLPRDERAILDEILELVRSQERRLTAVEERPLTSQPAYSKQVYSDDFYSSITIPVPPEESDAEAIATKLCEALVTLVPPSTVEIVKGPRGPVVRVEFLSPIHRSRANQIVTRASEMAGFILTSWGASHA